MTIPVIISLCILLLLAYAFDITAAKTKIPSVILLLLLGWLVKGATIYLEVPVPNLNPVLPVFGTLGLILIVLEGALELEISREKLPLIGQASFMALLPMLILSAGICYAFHLVVGTGIRAGLANAIPLAIISSAIAIPTAHHLIPRNREFVTYESSLSDIFGVIFFNFVTLNGNFGVHSVGNFLLELLVILFVSFAATLLLAYLLSKIRHHVKYVPIILMIFLIYALSKLYHLPALIFILLFGIFLGNLDEFKSVKAIRHLKPDILNREAKKLKELTGETAFIIRALFFLLFGFLIDTAELFNTQTIAWAIAITTSIFGLRYLFLTFLRFPKMPLLFIAPRGLITILLFLSIPVGQQIAVANKSLVIQVIVLTALVMMTGMVLNNPEKNKRAQQADTSNVARD